MWAKLNIWNINIDGLNNSFEKKNAISTWFCFFSIFFLLIARWLNRTQDNRVGWKKKQKEKKLYETQQSIEICNIKRQPKKCEENKKGKNGFVREMMANADNHIYIL